MRRALLVLAATGLGAAGPLRGQQLTPAGTGGVAALANALRQLGANKRVLVIGAHPDDEDSQLLTWLSRGLGAQAAYLSLNRGEGGQNLIGEELGPELGIIRSEELLAARSVDGAHQFFTRAYDFGFSKTADETFRFWPRDSVLHDVLDVIRRFRPQLIVSIFSGTPRDGHGNHQVAGILARQAFDLLRDSTWGPVKLYRSTNFDTAGTTLTIPTGSLDPLVGQSYFQIAMAGRSRHRSQDMGQLQRPGPAFSRSMLVASKVGNGAGLFAGVDTAWPGAKLYPTLIDSARAALTPYAPERIVPLLARAAAALPPGNDEQRAILDGAIAEAAGVVVDGTADDGIVVAGQRLQVEVSVWNAGLDPIGISAVDFSVPPGWQVDRLEPPGGSVQPGTIVARHFAVTIPADAPRSQPYFLRRPLNGAFYDWSGVPADVRGLPFEPPPLVAHVRATIGGATVSLSREVVYRYRDQGIGEIRRPILVTQPFDVAVSPGLIVWPVDGSGGGTRTVTVTVTNRVHGAATGVVRLAVPPGWSPERPESLSFTREDEERSAMFTVRLPPSPVVGTVTLKATVTGPDGHVSEGDLSIIDYPHIRPRPSVHPSTVEIRVAKILLPGLARVGYIRGASDRVPEALQQVGVPVVMLDADSLERGDLSKFDAIVVGSRAYETDPALVKSNGRVLDYARGGGLVIVQYQQYPFINGGYAPYRMTIAQPHDRVTDETAPVTLLHPDAPLFRSPNAIGADDWQRWVQERGLYFAHDWDSTYVPMLEMHDSGGPPLEGGVLVAPLGRGTYVYTGLSFFRELPAGVIGSYRLFANLLGLGARHVP
ncbi:MAG TPA: PIG-L family deacetylase [Gemmatimonadales bacterium]|nr:PIG-L family deacetylase [Gemmatimonadales bacterium]